MLVDGQAVCSKLKTFSMERRQAGQCCGSSPSLSQDTNVPGEAEPSPDFLTPVTVSLDLNTRGLLQQLHFVNQRLFQKVH